MTGTPHRPTLTINSPGGLAELLPFLLDCYPDDSIAVHCPTAPSLASGLTAATPIPRDNESWEDAAAAFAQQTLDTAHRHDLPPTQVVIYLCREPQQGRSPQDTADSLRPLAQALATAFAIQGVPVLETLCLSAGRWWSYQCDTPGCCDGVPLPPLDAPDSVRAELVRHGCNHGPRTSEIAAEVQPLSPEDAPGQSEAFENATIDLASQCLTPGGSRADAVHATDTLLEAAMGDFRNGATEIDNDTTARLILGLQDREARDHGMEYAEDDELHHARRLWTFLARHCIEPYTALAVPVLTLLGWVTWVQNDTTTSRIALRQALTADPDYAMTGLLHSAVNEEADPEGLRALLREIRSERRSQA